MKTHVAFASIAAITLLTSVASADDESDTVRKPSHTAHTAGVALTITGASFLGTGLVAGVGGIALGAATGGDNGFGGLVLAVVGSMIWGGCTVVGVATLIPGIVLMNNNRPLESFAFEPHQQQKAPGFTSIPILSGTF